MPLRDRNGQRWQPSGKPYVVAATKACSRFTGTCRELSPPSSPFPPLSFFAFWGVPVWNTQDHPFPSMVCPWTIVRSWEPSSLSSPFLSLSLSFLSFLSSPSSLGPGCFRHSWEPFLFGVSLDACVVAGSTFASFFLSLSFLPPLPSSFLARGVFTSKLGRFGLSSVCPRSFGSPFIGPHRRFSSFLSCLSVFMSLHPHPFFLLRVLSSGP